MLLAQRWAGDRWMAVWLTREVLGATLFWTLQVWLPPLWAFVGSLLPLLRIGIVSYWTESYWGGTCAAIGGDTSELQSHLNLVCRLLLEKKKHHKPPTLIAPKNPETFAKAQPELMNTRPCSAS